MLVSDNECVAGSEAKIAYDSGRDRFEGEVVGAVANRDPRPSENARRADRFPLKIMSRSLTELPNPLAVAASRAASAADQSL
jgi:hypothetical protein